MGYVAISPSNKYPVKLQMAIMDIKLNSFRRVTVGRVNRSAKRLGSVMAAAVHVVNGVQTEIRNFARN